MERTLIVASILVAVSAMPAVADDFTTHGGFKSVEEAMQLGEKHEYGVGTAWGVVEADSGPFRAATAMCPYVRETVGDTIAFNGHSTWSASAEDKIFTDWSGKFSVSTGQGAGPQTITGGTGKFANMQGAAPFQCQALNDKGQFVCSQKWELNPAAGSTSK
jgi:hypothetical protein